MDVIKIKENQKMKSKGKVGITGRRSRSSEKNAMKVVYISTPMKVKTSASKFMKIVQELTGRESDVVGIMETSGGKDTWMVLDHDHHHHHGMVPSLVVDDGSSPSCSSNELVDHHHHHHHHHDHNPFNQGVLERGQGESGPFDFNLLFDHQLSYHFDNDHHELGNY